MFDNIKRMLYDNSINKGTAKQAKGVGKPKARITHNTGKQSRREQNQKATEDRSTAESLGAGNGKAEDVLIYYTTRRLNPLKKMQPLMAIAAKLLRVFYAMLTKGVDYDAKKNKFVKKKLLRNVFEKCRIYAVSSG